MSTSSAATNSVLELLDVVLDEERDALRFLDSRTVEQIARKKIELESRLSDAIDGGGIEPDPTLLDRVQRKTHDNQILLVHARNCVRAALEAAGNPQETYGSNRPPRATRFDLKG
jgi:hypothetical protein